MTALITGLYGAVGVAALALVIVRCRDGRWVQAFSTALWMSLAWRVGIRYWVIAGKHDLGWLDRLTSNQWLIAVQLFLTAVSTFLMAIVEWEGRR